MNEFSFFLSPVFFWKSFYFQRAPIWLHLKLNYKIGHTESCSDKKHRDVSRTISASKMEFFIELFRGFHPLDDSAKNFI